MNEARALLIYGASGHGRVVADAAKAAGWQVAGWVDDDPAKVETTIGGLPVVASSFEEAVALSLRNGFAIVPGIGDNRARSLLFDRLLRSGLAAAAIVHPRATIAPSARLGRGTVVFAGAVVNPDARVGHDVIVNTAATIDHDCVLADHCHLSPGVHLGGTVHVGEGTHVGIGAAVRNNLAIGAWCVIGAGAAVVADLPDHVLAYGVPARIERRLAD